MNSINEIAKYKYEFNNNSPVNLDEYILLYDEALNEKYLLFKLYNGISEKLKKAECKVKIYNKNNFLIEEIMFSFNGEFDGSNYFIPENKLKVESDIASIRFDVISLEFETLKYIDGNIVRIAKTLADFTPKEEVTSKPVIKPSKWAKKTDKLKYKTTKKNVKKDNKRKYVTDVTKANKSKIQFIWMTIFSVLVIGYFVSSMMIYRITAKVASDPYNDYMLESGTYTLVDNYCESRLVEIPDKIDGIDVNLVAKNAFRDKTHIEEITLNSYIAIDDNAFNGCTNLTTINNPEYITYIGKNAFAGTRLSNVRFDNVGGVIGNNAFPSNTIKELYMPNATLDTNSLAGLNSLSTLEYNNISASKTLKMVFGDSSGSITSLRKVITYSDVSNADFDGFVNLNTVFLYGENTSFRSTLLKSNKITYFRLNASSSRETPKTIAERIGENYSFEKLHLNLGNNYNGNLLKEIDANLLIIENGSLRNMLFDNSGNISAVYICNNVTYSYFDFSRLTKNSNIKKIYFEGTVPSSLTNSGKAYGRIDRSAYGIEY